MNYIHKIIKANDSAIWKDIKYYEGIYKISNYGQVKSIKFGRELILKANITIQGYSQVCLCKEGKIQVKLIHRLVAQGFLGLDINNNKILSCHKNEKLINGGLDNSANNLFIGTHYDNIMDCIKKGRYNSPNYWKGKKGKLNYSSKKVSQYNLENKFIKTWDSISDIYRKLGIYTSNISKCCKGKRKTAGGFIWKY